MCIGKLITPAIVVLGCVCFVATHARSQDKPAGQDKQKSAGGTDDAMMKAYMESAAPGPHHKALAAMAGNFKYVNKFKMDPSQDWTTSEGEYDGTMAMDGRYLLTNVKGPMMGSSFVGMGCLGYDNTLQKHVAAWIDNMGTGIMRSEGTCDGTCKTVTYEGEMVDPMTKKSMKYKYVYETKSPDEFVMRWWSPSPTDGKMFESMIIEYKRVK
jgi:hypothetical protein